MRDLNGDDAGENVLTDLLFFTYADTKYDIFAVPYVFFALTANPDACVEIILEDLEDFSSRNRKAITQLHSLFGKRFLFRQSKTAHSDLAIRPGAVRFVEEPELIARNVYIGDIDLLVMENVLKVHGRLMEQHDLPFSNVIRPASIESGMLRLTGLHFCPYDSMYPLPDLSDLDLQALNDEHVLYTIMARRGLMVPLDFTARPDCGIHMSLSRDPSGRCRGPWYIDFSPETTAGWTGGQHFARIRDLLDNDAFRSLFLDFSYEFRVLFTALEAQVRGAERLLHRLAASYLVDRRFSDDWSPLLKLQLERERDEAMETGELEQADKICARVARLWPLNLESWCARASSALGTGANNAAIEALHHALDQSDDSSRHKVIEIATAHWDQLAETGHGDELFARIGDASCSPSSDNVLPTNRGS